jgi:penicillin-binding protein 1A
MSEQVEIEEKPQRKKRWLAVRLLLWLGGVGVLAGGAVGIGMYAHYSEDLPPFTGLEDYNPKLATRVYSVDGRLIGEFGTERRRLVEYERIPRRLIQAFIATEDKKFFDHGGIDYVGNVRAVLFKVIGKSSRIGGTSTITQQTAKSLLISYEGFEKGTERSIRRKAREAILARRLEAKLNKEEILYLYLNQVFLGHGAYGIQSASEHYFRKDVEELTLPEMALIAGLPQAPSRYSPLKSKKAAESRVKTVLSRMVRNGFITEAEKTKALSVDLASIVKPRDDRFRDTAPYFTEHVRRYIYDTYGQDALYEGGLQIYTTLDLERQAHAEDALVRGLRATDKRQGWRGAFANVKDEKKQDAILSYIEKTYVNGGELKEDESYMALVKEVNNGAGQAVVQVGGTKGILPLAGMLWGRPVNPERYWENHYVQKVSSVLKPGDLILVMKSNYKELRAEGTRTSAALKSIPKTLEGTNLFKLDQVPSVEGALIAMNPHTGYVESMIGGYAFEDSEFNRAFQSCRQPGSSFKPIVYSTAVVREDYTPGTMVPDTPITVRDGDIGKSWKPQNFEFDYQGEVTVRQALMNSMNIPALHTMQNVGIKNVLAFAKKLGVKTELKEELGTAIGSSCVTPWELTNVYTTFARGGLRPEPVFIKRVLDRDDKILEEHASFNDPWQTVDQRLDSLYRGLLQPPYRVMDSDDAFIVNYLLTQVATRGTAAKASKIGHPVAGKTGTTNDSFDTWFVGYTPSLVASVWVGYETYKMPLARREQGGRTSLPIWMSFMSKSLEGKKERDWSPPPGICHARVSNKTGARTNSAGQGTFLAPFRCDEMPEFAPVAGVQLEDLAKSGGI